ncbi:MAG TPA: hypothetical protein VFM99_09785, partial [Chitinophagales bacterium]|nr:hypothetical protein [Chitinophagales bacterium]
MKTILYYFLLIVIGIFSFQLHAFAQDVEIDSLKTVLKSMPEDTNKVLTLIELSSNYYGIDPIEAIT